MYTAFSEVIEILVVFKSKWGTAIANHEIYSTINNNMRCPNCKNVYDIFYHVHLNFFEKSLRTPRENRVIYSNLHG